MTTKITACNAKDKRDKQDDVSRRPLFLVGSAVIYPAINDCHSLPTWRALHTPFGFVFDRVPYSPREKGMNHDVMPIY
jgi:hypothetical protein